MDLERVGDEEINAHSERMINDSLFRFGSIELRIARVMSAFGSSKERRKGMPDSLKLEYVEGNKVIDVICYPKTGVILGKGKQVFSRIWCNG